MCGLSAATKDSLYILFTQCIRPYVLDTTFRMHLSGSYLASYIGARQPQDSTIRQLVEP